VLIGAGYLAKERGLPLHIASLLGLGSTFGPPLVLGRRNYKYEIRLLDLFLCRRRPVSRALRSHRVEMCVDPAVAKKVAEPPHHLDMCLVILRI
jgi:hypothetical protein